MIFKSKTTNNSFFNSSNRDFYDRGYSDAKKDHEAFIGDLKTIIEAYEKSEDTKELISCLKLLVEAKEE